MVKASAASYLWKKGLRKLGNETAATKHSQYGSYQDKEAIKRKKAYLKTGWV